MKFLHTADWQIGMKAAHVGEAGARVREERLAAAKRVVEAFRLLREWLDVPLFATKEEWEKWVAEFRPRVEAVVGKK